jgi:hypothetical protein
MYGVLTDSAGAYDEQESEADEESDGPVSPGVPGDQSTPAEQALRSLSVMRTQAQASNEVRGPVYACL